SADFVGGSGKDLAEAIRHAARESEYRYFWFDYASSAKEAHDLEHSWYHRYRPSDNPAPPNSVVSSAWRCTIRGCAACALAAAR
ncbi:MAG TPA: hypothetical protein VE968_05200, partial [Sphingomicrobium sp.]|nr:hypothetical protein [Sphingomicrobium sp.]